MNSSGARDSKDNPPGAEAGKEGKSHPKSGPVATLRQQIDTLKEPMLVDIAHPALVEFLQAKDRNASHYYVGQGRIMFPNTAIKGGYIFPTNPGKKGYNITDELYVFDLATNKTTILSIDIAAQRLLCLFVTRDHKIITIDKEGVKIWILNTNAANSLELIKINSIPLPKSFSDKFDSASQFELKKAFNIQMFPDGKHIGILYASDEVTLNFYLVDSDQAKYNAFSFDTLRIHEFMGFVPKSPTEIYLELHKPTEGLRWYQVNFECALNRATVNPKSFSQSFRMYGTRDENYSFYLLDNFMFQTNVHGDYHDLSVSVVGDSPRLAYVGENRCPMYFPNAKTLCVPDARGNSLEVFTIEEDKSGDPTQSRLINKTLKIAKERMHVAPCDDQAVLIYDKEGSRQIQVCIFPRAKIVEQQLKDTMALLEPGVGELTTVGINKIILDSLGKPEVCPFLTSDNPKMVITNYSTFISSELKQIDLSKLTSLKKVGSYLENIDSLKNQVLKNLSLVGGYKSFSYLENPLKNISYILAHLSTVEKCKKFFFGTKLGHRGLFRNTENVENYRVKYQDKNLFRDSNNFKQDMLKIFHKELEQEIKSKEELTDLSSCSYMMAVIIPEMLNRMQFDKVLDIAQGFVIKMVPPGLYVAPPTDDLKESALDPLEDLDDPLKDAFEDPFEVPHEEPQQSHTDQPTEQPSEQPIDQPQQPLANPASPATPTTRRNSAGKSS